ncbi:DUF1648 domain-containing protein [Gordonia sp. X0973]|uniref:DUF1648 domain-containing protein n=1 Tax=Gordonia sp. X0973 TaxID=2742602 RepID=UPI0013EC674F|nr:DUF1648 domain-containing protein [Gordonia sp. X0973]QKT08602.1 DUF1648 domain-containing protein [Gordonia sp. X0973]
MSRSLWTLALTWVGVVLTWIWVAVAAPDRVPMHWGIDGQVDRWAGRGEYLVTTGLTAVATTVVMVAVGVFAPRLPDSMINTPHREYWLSERRRPAFDALTRNMMFDVAAVVILLLTAINVITAIGTDGQYVWLPVVVVFVLLLVAVTVGPILRLYREPVRR